MTLISKNNLQIKALLIGVKVAGMEAVVFMRTHEREMGVFGEQGNSDPSSVKY